MTFMVQRLGLSSKDRRTTRIPYDWLWGGGSNKHQNPLNPQDGLNADWLYIEV